MCRFGRVQIDPSATSQHSQARYKFGLDARPSLSTLSSSSPHPLFAHSMASPRTPSRRKADHAVSEIVKTFSKSPAELCRYRTNCPYGGSHVVNYNYGQKKFENIGIAVEVVRLVSIESRKMSSHFGSASPNAVSTFSRHPRR